MIDSLRWFLVLEAIGLAFLPVAVWSLGRLPDRGFGLSKILGLVLLTYVTWLVGSFLPIARGAALPFVVIVVGAGAGWWVWRRETVDALRASLRVVALEEALLVAGLIVWSVLRAQVIHPAIGHTEQYMDMSLFGASIHAASYPPQDPWMSGHTVNYYYLGYLAFGLLSKLGSVSPSVGYNLALSTVAALSIVGSYSLLYALTASLRWAPLGPLFLTALGNWWAIVQQVPHNLSPANCGCTWWFFNSSRVIGSAADYTINEFPFFSFLLGDLHPHVMALPVTLLAIGFGASFLNEPATDSIRAWRVYARLFPPAVVAGSLFAMNSWDFPTYLGLLTLCLGLRGYMLDATARWWQAPLTAGVVLGLMSVILYAPFYLHFRSLAHGVGLVSTPSDLWQFVQVFGPFLLPVLLLVAGVTILLQPAASETEDPRVAGLQAVDRPGMETGAVRLSGVSQGIATLLLLSAAFVAARAHLWVLLLMSALAIGAAVALQRVALSERPNRADAAALLLVLCGCLVVALPEVVYIRDSFDGGSSYRMNTVFKFYYQGWTLLGLAAGYGAFRAWGIARRLFQPWLAPTLLLLVGAGAAGGGVYTYYALQSPIQDFGDRSLDGAQWMNASTQHPDDARAIAWLARRAAEGAVELEATGGEYSADFARVTTFSGLPTVMGWAGHEYQWRGPDAEIAQRVADIRTIYSTRDLTLAKHLLRRYHVRYVFVGDTEHACVKEACYSGTGLKKFSRFMHVAFRSGRSTIYTWNGTVS